MRSFSADGLPRGLWLVVLGILLNYLGYGAVLPFEVIYLHDGRGFSLGAAGLTVGLVTGVAVVAAPLAGPLIDRFGARAVAAVAGVALAAGYAGLAFAASPAPAFLAAAVAGAGNGALNPSQSTLVATLAPAHLRHRATGLSRVAANVGAAGGAGLGGLVAARGLPGFIGLYVVNGLTYLGYVAILLAAVPGSDRPGDGRPEAVAGRYRTVARDRAFVQLALVNLAMIAVGWGVFTWLVPPYAQNRLGVDARLIGVLLLANAATVAVAQLPVARFAEGRRRVVMVAAAAGTFVVACGLVLLARPGVGYPLVLVACVLVGIGECLHTTVLMPLVADLAPAGLRGRYMASMGLSWWAGLAVAPALGAQLLAVSGTATFAVSAVLALAAGVGALSMEPRIPVGARLTPGGPRVTTGLGRWNA